MGLDRAEERLNRVREFLRDPDVPRATTTLRPRLILSRFEPPDPDFHLDTRAQVVENGYEPVSRKSTNIGVPDAREVGRGESGSRLRGPNGQLLPIERLDDFGRQNRLQLLDICILTTQIAENVTAPA
jgi:hypothetical protein